MLSSLSSTAQAQWVNNITVTISSEIVSDPVSAANPKAIPSALIEYSANISNNGTLWLTEDSLTVTNPVPSGMSFFVGDLNLSGSGPIQFAERPRLSTLTCIFGGLADGADCVELSNDGGALFTYQPQPDATGFDAVITHTRIRPKGSMAPALVEPSRFTLRY